MFFNSIRVTLTIWYVGVLAVIIVAFALTIDVLVSRNLNQMASMNLADALDTVVVALHQEETDIAKLRSSGPPSQDDPTLDKDDEREVTNLTMEEKIVEEIKDLKLSGYFIMVFNQQGAVSISTLEDDVLQNELLQVSTATASADLQGKNDSFRIQQRSLTLDGKEFRLIVARSLREQMAFINFLRRIVYCTIPVAILLAAAGGYFMARRSLAPIVSMSKQAQKISSSNLNERLPVKNESDELGGLATVFNALLERLESTFERQHRFIADASHEFRTPLAIIRTEAEVAVSNRRREPAEYCESLAIVHEESKRLADVVDDLLLFAQADRGQYRTKTQSVCLQQILTQSIRALRSLADKRNVRVHFSANGGLPLWADEGLLHRLFLNLLDNAIKYNREGGEVTIETGIDKFSYVVLIRDTGIGISPENQLRIFDRFYRSDEARCRDPDTISGGAGLGLSIAASICKMHNGTIALDRSDALGSVFRLEFPMAENVDFAGKDDSGFRLSGG